VPWRRQWLHGLRFLLVLHLSFSFRDPRARAQCCSNSPGPSIHTRPCCCDDIGLTHAGYVIAAHAQGHRSFEKKATPSVPTIRRERRLLPPPPPPRWMAVLAFNLSAPTTLSTNELGPLIVDGCARLIIAADVVAHRAWDPSKSNYISRSPAPPLRHHQIADVRVPRSAVSHTIAAFRKHAFILLCPRFPNPIPRNGFDRFSKSFSARLVPLAQKRRATEATLVGRAGLKPSAVVAFEFSFSGAVRHGHGRPH
jgi:hypothetical protein